MTLKSLRRFVTLLDQRVVLIQIFHDGAYQFSQRVLLRSDNLIRIGVVADYAELARLGHVTRARITQIMNLLNLAPDIQEAILHLPRVESGRDSVTERELRPIVAKVDWGRQRGMWGQNRP